MNQHTPPITEYQRILERVQKVNSVLKELGFTAKQQELFWSEIIEEMKNH